MGHGDEKVTNKTRSMCDLDAPWYRARVSKGRLEAFSDGVIAILITIMVLELKVPHGHDWDALRPMLPFFGAYVLSFVLVAIYWNNHHHMLHLTKRINGKILWANNHLLFWLSLVPFGTAWHGEHFGEKAPTVAYAHRPLHGRHRVRGLAESDHRRSRRGLAARGRRRKRPEGPPLGALLRHVDRRRFLLPVGRGRALRRRRAHVARPGSPRRAAAQGHFVVTEYAGCAARSASLTWFSSMIWR